MKRNKKKKKEKKKRKEKKKKKLERPNPDFRVTNLPGVQARRRFSLGKYG